MTSIKIGGQYLFMAFEGYYRGTVVEKTNVHVVIEDVTYLGPKKKRAIGLSDGARVSLPWCSLVEVHRFTKQKKEKLQ